MTMTVSRGCLVCGWGSKPREIEDGAEYVQLEAEKHDCYYEPIARALCDAKRGEGHWDNWVAPSDVTKFGRRARRLVDALLEAGLTIVPRSPIFGPPDE